MNTSTVPRKEPRYSDTVLDSNSVFLQLYGAEIDVIVIVIAILDLVHLFESPHHEVPQRGESTHCCIPDTGGVEYLVGSGSTM